MPSRPRVAAAILAIAALASFCHGTLRFPAESKARVFPRSFVDQVDEVAVRGPREGFPLIFRLVEGRWYLLFDGDRPYPANGERIAGLLRALGERRHLRRLDAGDAFGYGTDVHGSCQITLRSRSGVGGISFGSRNADGRLRYAKKEGDSSVIALDDDISSWLDNATAPWLDRYPFARMREAGAVRATAYGRGLFLSLEDTESLDGILSLVSGISVADITNIPAEPSFRLRIERGDTGVTVLSFALLDERDGIVTDESSGLSWILPAAAVRDILLAFQHFSAM